MSSVKLTCGGKSKTGFTLIEVVIVLAISSALAMILIGLYRGQGDQARFTDAIEGVVSQLESVKTEVNSGYSGGTGSSQNRVFFGKVVRFSSGSGKYSIQTLTAANSDTLTGLTLENDQRDLTLPWGIVLDSAVNNYSTLIFARNLTNAQLRTYVLEGRADVLNPVNYQSAALVSSSLDFSDPNLSPPLRATVMVEAPTGKIIRTYVN